MGSVSLVRVFLTLSAFAVLLVISAAIYQQIEDISFTDAWFHATMSATTIGYANSQPRTEAGKVFTSLFSFVTIGAFLFAIDAFRNADLESLRHRRK